MFGRLGKGSAEDGDMDDNADADDMDGNADIEAGDGNEEETSDSDEDPPVQRVRLEGVADVRPVGPAAGGLIPAGEPAGSGEATQAGVPNGGQSVDSALAAADAETSTQASPEENSPEGESAPEEDGEGKKKTGIDLSLKDIFEEAVSVDENLKDLADSQEDIRAEDLAGELREFLSELER